MDTRVTDRRTFLLGSALVSAWALGCGSTQPGRAGRDAAGAPSEGGRDGGPASPPEGHAGVEGPGGHTAEAGRPGDAGAPGGGGGTTGVGDSGAECELTDADIEGPFFTPDSPEREDLREPGMVGEPLRLRGRVLDGRCRPVANAVVELWQADASGAYDTEGFRLRGHVPADAAGAYEFSTIVPGRYLNGGQFRPAHLHVKVYVEGVETLTTQLYFAGDPYNDIDPWFSEETMLRPVQTGAEQLAEFDFIV